MRQPRAATCRHSRRLLLSACRWPEHRRRTAVAAPGRCLPRWRGASGERAIRLSSTSARGSPRRGGRPRRRRRKRNQARRKPAGGPGGRPLERCGASCERPSRARRPWGEKVGLKVPRKCSESAPKAFRLCRESPEKGPFRGPKVDRKSSQKCLMRWPFWFARGATCGTFGFRSGTFGPLSSTERYVEPHRRCVRRGAKVGRKGRGRSRTGGESGSFGNFRVTSGSTSTPLDRGNKEHSGRSGALPGCKGVLVGTGGRAGKKNAPEGLGNGCRRRAGRAWWWWLVVRQRATRQKVVSMRRRARARTAVRA